jgi:hypothetical protein
MQYGLTLRLMLFKAASAAVEKNFPERELDINLRARFTPPTGRAGMIDYGDLIALGVLYLRNLDTMELIPRP